VAKSDLRIDVLGTSFSISADEDQTYLESLLSYYRIKIENTRKKTGLQDPLKLALVTGFLLCDEVQKGKSAEDDEAERLALDLISRIDAALPAEEADTAFSRAAGPFDAAPGGAFPGAENASPGGSTGGTGPSLPPVPCGPAPADRRRYRPFFKLENTIKHYAWGSVQRIPRLLNRANAAAEPWAELWMGVHPAGPSRVVDGAQTRPLDAVIAEAPGFYLGERVERTFGGLPFLFKLLAAERPLSIQAHPDLAAARAGFERESRAGIPLENAARNYRDRNHKPELLCAMGDFRALAGFRERNDIIHLLGLFGGEEFTSDERGVKPSPLLKAAFENIKTALLGDDGLKDMLALLLGMEKETRRDLGVYTLAQAPQLEEAWSEYREEWRAAARIAELYPEDAGILAPLYLNLIRLKSGEAIFLPPGMLHAYLEGFGVELQANSDNVLRGGLTSKHVDTEELLSILRFAPYRPAALQAAARSGADNWYFYPLSCREFSLSITQCRNASVRVPVYPAIVLVTQGEARLSVSGSTDDVVLSPGESAFVAPGEAYLSGAFTAFAAGPGEVLPFPALP
jgi:mannose-6-phosphate isomerase